MKANYDNFFAESEIERINNEIEELAKEAMIELGFSNTEKDSEEEINLSKDQEQKVMDFVINKKIFTKGENIKHLWAAINNISLSKINELKSNIDDDEYVETLLISYLLNSMTRNDKVIKFLLTETEIFKYPNLKAKILPDFLNIDNKSELNEEIIELLRIDNESTYKEALCDVLWNSNIPDRLFIISFEDTSAINEPLIRKVSHDQGQTFHNEECSLLMKAIQSNRLELAQYLVNQGAKVLLDEVDSLLWNTNVSDELLISYFEDTPDINKPLIRKVSHDQGQTFHNEECSLLMKAMQSNRLELAHYLVNKGAKVLLDEVDSLLWNANVSDELLINCLDSTLDVNKPLIRKLSYDQGQTFHNEECSLLMKAIQSNRLELAQYLVNQGAKVLLDEVESLLWSTNVSDELLISYFEDTPDINKPLIRKVSYAQGQTFHNEECSLLMKAIQFNRLELAHYLVNKGANVNFEDSKQESYIQWLITKVYNSLKHY